MLTLYIVFDTSKAFSTAEIDYNKMVARQSNIIVLMVTITIGVRSNALVRVMMSFSGDFRPSLTSPPVPTLAELY